MNRFTKDYVYSSLKENTKTRELVETYDLEIDCETHSFIANNTIVHNSVYLQENKQVLVILNYLLLWNVTMLN